MKKETTNGFISKANGIHKGAYVYSKVNYFDSIEKVIIICPAHGEFLQSPALHLCGNGCPKCANVKTGLKNTKTGLAFIQDANKIHNNKYAYVHYINSKTKAQIICPIHGVFFKTPNAHLNGQGCPTCSKNKRVLLATKSLSDFVTDASFVHGDRYDYSSVIYKGNKVKVKMICQTHGEFCQTPKNHLHGHGCPACAIEYKSSIGSKSTVDFVMECRAIHGDKYDYTNTTYMGSSSKVVVRCFIHGNFKIKASHHLSGNGCQRCSGCHRRTTSEFIRESIDKHGDKYDYSQTEYVNSTGKVDIICKKHGLFSQTAAHHLKGFGCLSCSKSRGENEVERSLLSRSITFDKQKTFDGCRSIG